MTEEQKTYGQGEALEGEPQQSIYKVHIASLASEPPAEVPVVARAREPPAEISAHQSTVFMERLNGMIHHDNVRDVIKEQEEMLRKLEVANMKLTRCNDVSEATFDRLSGSFVQNTKLIVDMKKELDTLFRRIRSLKVKVQSFYPGAYEEAEFKHRKLMDEDGELS